MQITTRNINLSDANRIEIANKLKKYTKNVKVSFNNIDKIFKISCKLTNVPKNSIYYDGYFAVSGINFHSVLNDLKNKLKASYSKTNDFNASKVSLKNIEIIEDEDIDDLLTEDDLL